MKKILLVTSAFTGSGHQSISEALEEQFAEIPGVEVKTVEGFDMSGWVGGPGSRIYSFATRRIPRIFNAVWEFTSAHPPGEGWAVFFCCRRFLECVRGYQPDLVLTVHSLFNEAATRILKKGGLDIPVVVLQADLVSIHRTWCNPDALMTICPTQEAYEASRRFGLPPERLARMGFPIRRRFTDLVLKGEMRGRDLSGPPRCLLMSGGEGAGNLKAYAEAILGHTDAELTVVCGHNRELLEQLKAGVAVKYGSRMTVLGYVDRIEQEMLRSDLLLTRSSPNTLLEAVMLELPVIMVGTDLAQERGNTRLMEKNGLGVSCPSADSIPQTIAGLLAGDGKRLQEIRAAQRAFRRPEDARNVAAFVASLIPDRE